MQEDLVLHKKWWILGDRSHPCKNRSQKIWRPKEAVQIYVLSPVIFLNFPFFTYIENRATLQNLDEMNYSSAF